MTHTDDSWITALDVMWNQATGRTDEAEGERVQSIRAWWYASGPGLLCLFKTSAEHTQGR